VTTVLRASPRRFVSTPAVERIIARALRYLHSGYSVHLRGPAGTGKTTMALHMADLLARPIMLVFGDDEFKTSDLIGNQSGYTRKKVVDNYIHSVVKVEDELRQTWVDSRLTLACREGFTLVYDEFNRSRPEVNNVLLSALEEKLLVLPPSGNRSEYIRVHNNFRTIFTSNPEEYCGVHSTQDALLDRLVTINVPEPDELTQQEILTQKTGISRGEALGIVHLIKEFRAKTQTEKSSGLRAGMMIAKVCQEHDIPVSPENADFRDICGDVLLSRVGLSLETATRQLWELLNAPISIGLFTNDGPVSKPVSTEIVSTENTPIQPPEIHSSEASDVVLQTVEDDLLEDDLLEDESTEDQWAGMDLDTAIATDLLEDDFAEDDLLEDDLLEDDLLEEDQTTVTFAETTLSEIILSETAFAETTLADGDRLQTHLKQTSHSLEQRILSYLRQTKGAKLSEIEQTLALERFEMVDALRLLIAQELVLQQDRLYIALTNR
jgi:gas vesicle protein GvpN